MLHGSEDELNKSVNGRPVVILRMDHMVTGV